MRIKLSGHKTTWEHAIQATREEKLPTPPTSMGRVRANGGDVLCRGKECNSTEVSILLIDADKHLPTPSRNILTQSADCMLLEQLQARACRGKLSRNYNYEISFLSQQTGMRKAMIASCSRSASKGLRVARAIKSEKGSQAGGKCKQKRLNENEQWEEREAICIDCSPPAILAEPRRWKGVGRVLLWRKKCFWKHPFIHCWWYIFMSRLNVSLFQSAYECVETSFFQLLKCRARCRVKRWNERAQWGARAAEMTFIY